MPIRKPLVLIGGEVRELPSTDFSSGQTPYAQFVSQSSRLISEFIPESIWNNIVAGTNTTPVGVYVQNALTECKNTHSTLVFSPYTILIEIGLVYDYGAHSIVGNGVKLDFSNVNVGVTIAFSIVTPHNYYPLWDSAIHSISGVNFKGKDYGAGRTAGLTGVQFGVGLADTGAHASFYNNSISGFDVCINFGHHSYVQKIDSCAIHNGNVAILYSGISLEDSGERIGFTNCVIFNSNTLVKAISGNISLSNCSFDYFTEEAIIAEFGGSVYITDSHIESINNPNIKPWMVCRDSNSRICLSNTIIIVNESISVYIGVADDSVDGSDTGSADAGIYLSNSHVSFTPTGEYTLQSIFKGAVYVTNIASFDGGRYSPANKRVHIHVDRNNLLTDGSFEKNASPLDWVVSSGASYTQPTISTNQAVTGTKSLRLAPTGGNTTKIRKSFQISPGGKPTVSFKTFGTIPSGSFLTATVGYDSPFYDSDVSSRTFVYQYTSTEVSTSWAVETIRPYSRAPLGATRFYVELVASGAADVYIDDFNIEILDNHVASIDLTDTPIDKLSDVDTSTVAPTDGQSLVWSSASGKWYPGTVSGGGGGELSATANESITGIWNFAPGTRVSNFTFSGGDINDVTTVADTGLTLNYTSPSSGSYYRDFTIFNGKGLAAMKITGASRTATFYSSLQFGAITASLNQILYTGVDGGDPGDTAEIAVNYNSGFNPSTNTYSSPYYRNFHIFDGKGASLIKFSGNGYKIEANTNNWYFMSEYKMRSNGLTNTIMTALSANRITVMPDASGTIALQEWVSPLVAATRLVSVAYKTSSYTITQSDYVLLFDAPALQTATLPAASLNTGRMYKLSNVGSMDITIASNGGSIQWMATQILVQQTQKTVISDGNNWFWC